MEKRGDSMQKNSELIHNSINQILHTSPSLKFVLLIDKNGIMISKVTKLSFFDSEREIDKLAVFSTAVCASAEEQGLGTPFGDLKITISEYNNGIIFITPIKNAIIVVGAEHETQIGLIRSKIYRIKSQIENAIDSFISEDLFGDAELNDQLKVLFQDTNGNF